MAHYDKERLAMQMSGLCPPSPTTRQVGGRHYQTGISPIEYINKNNLGFCEGNVVKYVTRHRTKNGKEDLEKAIHYLELLIEQEYSAE